MRNSYDTRALCLRALPPAFMFHPIRKGPLTYFLLFLFIYFFSKHFHVRVALKIGGRRGFIFISTGTLAAMRLAVIGEELFSCCTLEDTECLRFFFPLPLLNMGMF